jgi:hypothetical protein
MESFCFGVFLLIFFAGAALLAAPIASAVTTFVAKRQGTQVAGTVHPSLHDIPETCAA